MINLAANTAGKWLAEKIRQISRLIKGRAIKYATITNSQKISIPNKNCEEWQNVSPIVVSLSIETAKRYFAI